MYVFLTSTYYPLKLLFYYSIQHVHDALEMHHAHKIYSLDDHAKLTNSLFVWTIHTRLTHVKLHSLLEFHESDFKNDSKGKPYHEFITIREMDSIPQEFHQRSKGN